MNSIVTFFITKLLQKTNFIAEQIAFLSKNLDGYAIFTESVQFRVPYGINTIYVSGSGAGGGGASGGTGAGDVGTYGYHGGGGGSGGNPEYIIDQEITVYPNEVLTVEIGAGGVGGSSVQANPHNLSATSSAGIAGGDGGYSRIKRGNDILLNLSGGSGGTGGNYGKQDKGEGGRGGTLDGNDGESGKTGKTGGAGGVSPSFNKFAKYEDGAIVYEFGRAGAGGSGATAGGDASGAGLDGNNGVLIVCFGTNKRFADVIL